MTITLSKIDPSRQSDVELFCRMYAAYEALLDSYSSVPFPALQKDLPLDKQIRNAKHWYLDRSDLLVNCYLIHCEDVDVPVGFIIVQTLIARSQRPTLYVCEFGLLPEYRRLGIGQAVVKELLRLYPYEHLFWYTIKGNAPANAFWQHVVDDTDNRLNPEKRPDIRSEPDLIKWCFSRTVQIEE